VSARVGKCERVVPLYTRDMKGGMKGAQVNTVCTAGTRKVNTVIKVS
jgi:hypothetical protein